MSDVNQLLFAEAVLKGVGGLLLIILPGLSIRFLGLPRVETYFWPRMMGGMLVGLAMASVLEGTLRAQGGLGLAGSIVINLSVAAVLGSLLILGKTTPTRRGRFTLWFLLTVLVLLSLTELIFAN